MIIDLLKKRCSVRAFKDMEIKDSIIEEILEAGRLSPSGGNEQSWKFGVLSTRERIQQIAEASYNQNWIKSSPLVIVLCTMIVDDSRGARTVQEKRFPRYNDDINKMDKTLYSYLNMEEHQTKIAGTHMSLCALEHGIHSTWISYFDVEKVGALLTLPSDLIPSEMLAFGYPQQEPCLTEKKPLSEIVFYS